MPRYLYEELPENIWVNPESFELRWLKALDIPFELAYVGPFRSNPGLYRFFLGFDLHEGERLLSADFDYRKKIHREEYDGLVVWLAQAVDSLRVAFDGK